MVGEPRCELAGDATVVLVSPMEFSDAFEPLREQLRGNTTAAVDVLDDQLEGWTARAPDLEHLTAGSATFHRRTPSGVRVLLRHDEPAALTERLGACGPVPLEVAGLEVILFDDATISVACRLVVRGGWDDDGKVLRWCFGPDVRDRVCDSVRVEIERELGPVVDVVAGEARRASIPYFHLLYTGRSTHPQPGYVPVSDAVRPLIYSESVGPVTTASPRPTEFVHAGYAFSLVAVGAEVADPDEVVDRYVVLVQLAQSLYRRVARTCDDIERMMQPDPSATSDTEELWRWEFSLQGSVHAFLTPTFTYDHAVLVVRDRLLEAWRLSSLLERAAYLTNSLHLAQQRRRDARERKRQRLLGLLVALVTVLSLAEILDSGMAVYDRLVAGMLGG